MTAWAEPIFPPQIRVLDCRALARVVMQMVVARSHGCDSIIPRFGSCTNVEELEFELELVNCKTTKGRENARTTQYM